MNIFNEDDENTVLKTSENKDVNEGRNFDFCEFRIFNGRKIYHEPNNDGGRWD